MATKTNVFTNAKTVVDPTPKLKKGEKEEVFIKDLDIYSACDATIKTLTGIKDTVYRKSVIDDMIDTFVKNTITTNSRPANFKGINKNSEASCELRKRSSKSPLSITELGILKQYKIRTETVVLSPAKEESFMMSPEVMEALNKNPKLADKLSDALVNVLGSVPSLKGKDLILRIAPKEEESVEIVSDNSFEDAATLTSVDSLKQVYEVIATPSVTPKMITGDFKTALSILGEAGIKLNTTTNDKKSK